MKTQFSLQGKKSWIKSKKINFKGRSYKKYNKGDFQDSLIDLKWDNYYRIDDPNILWDILRKAINTIIDPICPMRNFKVPEAREPWVTNEMLEAIRDKDNLLKLSKRSKLEVDWERAKRARNEVGRAVKNLRSDYLRNQQTTHKNDPKEFWKSISAAFPGKKKSSAQIWLKDLDSGSEIKGDDIPNFMNSFFTNVGPNLAKQHTSQWINFGPENYGY